MGTFFTDFFNVPKDVLEDYGAFNVSLVNDLPLFIDPFLLFNSDKDEYRRLHDEMIRYLVFLRDKATSDAAADPSLRLWYCFPEIKQNWLGFSVSGNSGSGLGIDFARALHANLHKLFQDFGKERVTEGSRITMFGPGASYGIQRVLQPLPFPGDLYLSRPQLCQAFHAKAPSVFPFCSLALSCTDVQTPEAVNT